MLQFPLAQTDELVQTHSSRRRKIVRKHKLHFTWNEKNTTVFQLQLLSTAEYICRLQNLMRAKNKIHPLKLVCVQGVRASTSPAWSGIFPVPLGVLGRGDETGENLGSLWVLFRFTAFRGGWLVQQRRLPLRRVGITVAVGGRIERVLL